MQEESYSILGSKHIYMYALRNTNIARIQFFMTKYAIVLAIMDMASTKSDVNGSKKVTKHKIDFSKIYRPSLHWTIHEFYNFLKRFDYMLSDLSLKCSLLTLDFSFWLSGFKNMTLFIVD